MNYVVKIESKNGINVVSSRVVAKELGKNHSDVLDSLNNILEKGDFHSLIIPSLYQVKGQKRNYKEYLLTKDGFTLYMFNIQGYNDFKMAYINEFNRMEQALKEAREQKKLPFSEIKPTTWRGVPVMEVQDLAKLTNITDATIHWYSRNEKINLRFENLKKYKKENSDKDYTNISAITVLYKEMVISLCKKYGVYEKYKDFLENYFKEVKEIEYKNREYGLEHLRSEANKLKQKFLKEQFLITEKIQELDKTGLTDKMTVHRNNKNELILITHFD